MEVNTEECSFKTGPILSSLTPTWFSALQPSSRNCKCREMRKNHYSHEKVVYLPDSWWLITVEAVSMATSSFAAKGKWDFHPISFEMALVFSERGKLDLLEQEFCCKTPNSASPNVFLIPLSTLSLLIIHQEKTGEVGNLSSRSMIIIKLDAEFGAGCVT